MIEPIIECSELSPREVGIRRCNVCNSENNVKLISVGTKVGNQSNRTTITLCEHCRIKLAEELKK